MAKYLPILFGLTLGWFISHPPTWIWRVVTGSNPHLGSITQQPHVRKHLERK